MKQINNSRILLIVQISLVFLILLVANTYTYYICDDFFYFFNCHTGEPLSCSIAEHIDSIIAHSYGTNGRYIAHFIAQYMLNLPKWIFNILNAMMFTMQVLLCYLICKSDSKETNNILFLGIFGATWVFEPLIGQTNLWVMGSCNYLWALVAVLCFVRPIYRFYVFNRTLTNAIEIVLFLVVSFVAGAFNEAASSAGIFIVVLFLMVMAIEKRKIPWYFFAALLIAILGYLTMIFAPAEINAKATSLSIYQLSKNFITCATMYIGYLPIILAYIVLFFVALSVKADLKDIVSSIVLLLGSLFSNFIFIFAAYYSGHCAGTSEVLLVVSTGVLITAIYKKGERCISFIIPALIIPLMCYNIIVGLDDIHFTNYQARLAVEYIENSKEKKIMNVKYPEIEAKTTYSAYYGMADMNHDNPQMWPNSYMAKFFGVDEVQAVDSIRDIPEIQEIAW